MFFRSRLQLTPPSPYYADPLPIALMSVYLVYAFRHFETAVSVHHPLERAMQHRLGDFFRHPLDADDAVRGLQICPFGQAAVLALVAFLWLRLAVVRGGGRRWLSAAAIRAWSLAVLGGTAALSLLNMNAVLYLLPYFAAEAVAARMLINRRV